MSCPICAWTPEVTSYSFLYETLYWRAVLPPNQSLLGTCVLHLKRHASSLSELTGDEAMDFHKTVQAHERVIQQAFGATMYNWSCLMNLTYRETSPNPHVHWWVMPRYRQPVNIQGVEFTDPLFGSPFSHERVIEVAGEIRAAITKRIQDAREVFLP